VSLLACRRLVFRLAAVVAMAFVALPFGLSLASLVVSPARAADPASQLIDATVAEVIEIIKTKTGAARQAAIQQVLETKFDLPYMGQIALGTHWAKTTEEQRMRFLKATATAEAKAYSERFGQYAGQTVNVGKMTTRPNGLFIVESRINQSNGQPIKLEWEVRQGAQGLRITDVKVEGVSMVMTRRSDFNSYIQSNGGKVQPLVDELEARARQ
jgi:phospholipid transport system substrate-binding protein